MRLRCIDGKVRRFKVAGERLYTVDGRLCGWYHWEEAECLECGKGFGVHDTRILKPDFKKHICKEDKKK